MNNTKITPPHLGRTLPKLVILGTSETADRLAQFIEHYSLFEIVGYAVNSQYYSFSEFRGLPVWKLEELDKHIDFSEVQVVTGLFWNHLNADRRKLYEYTKSLFPSIRFANVVSPTAVNRGSIGENNWLMDYVVLQEDSRVADNCILADFSFIGHRTFVDSHCFIAARSTVGGTCNIGMQTFVGIAATIFNDTTIGDKCLIGATTSIKRNVPPYTVVKVSTENQVYKQYSPDEIENKWVAKRNIR